MIKNKKYKNNCGLTRRYTTEGFSTLELLIAMTILIMVLSAVIFVIFGDQSLSIDSETNAEALTKAQAQLEKAQADARKDFKLVNPVDTTPDDIYQKTIFVSNVDFFTKKITSSIIWTGDHNRPQHIDLTALITNFENVVGGDTCYSNLSGDWTKPKVINTDTNHQKLATIVGDSAGSYPITDVDTYQGKLYVTVNNSTVVPSPANTIATTAQNITTTGNVAWSNPNNALTSNGSNATSANLNNTKVTNYLKLTGFNFSIPAWATITGIKIEIQKSRGSGSGSIYDSRVQIVKNGVIGGTSNTNKAGSNPWSSFNSYTTDNYSTDLWGETWSPADINNLNFGVAISATGSSGGSRTAQIDNARITITYIRQFYVLDITDPTNPKNPISLGSNSITTALNAVTTDGKYAYVATNSSSSQLQIIDLSVTPPQVISPPFKIGTTGTSVGNSIFYKNGYVYLGLTNTAGGPKEFNVIDVHTPNNPLLVGSATIGNTVNSIYVLGNYAYVASPNSNNVSVFDVGVSKLSTSMTSLRNFSTPSALPDSNGSGSNYGKSLYVVGDTIYLGRTYGTNELYVLNNSTPTTITELGHKDIGTGNTMSINSLIIRDFLAFFINTAGQFQIWRTDAPTTITRYDTTPLSAFPVSGNNTPLDCEGNNIYGAYTDSASKGYITVISSTP